MLPTSASPVLSPMRWRTAPPNAAVTRSSSREPCGALQRGVHGVHRVIGIVERRAEHRHDGVADVLVDEAAVRLDDVGHGGEVFVHRRDQVGRRDFLPNGGEVRDVGEIDVTLRISPPSAGGLFDAIIFSITAGAR